MRFWSAAKKHHLYSERAHQAWDLLLRKFFSFPVGDYRVWRKDRKLDARSRSNSLGYQGTGENWETPGQPHALGGSLGMGLGWGLVCSLKVTQAVLWRGDCRQAVSLFLLQLCAMVCTEGEITIFSNSMLNITCLFSQGTDMQIFTFISFACDSEPKLSTVSPKLPRSDAQSLRSQNMS